MLQRSVLPFELGGNGSETILMDGFQLEGHFDFGA